MIILGTFGYALNKLEPYPGSTGSPAYLNAYEWAIVQDHLLRRAVFVALPSVPAQRRAELRRRFRQSAVEPRTRFSVNAPFVSNFSEAQYKNAFEQIQQYIQAGDCYQVNLAQRFSTSFTGDPWPAYKQLRRAAAAPYSAYITLPDNNAIMSLSPERFIAVHGRHVETSPIKGTRPRGANAQSDQDAAQALINSGKDRAENLMIVDLLRNDLGKVAKPGSVKVPSLFAIESFPVQYFNT